MKSLCFHAKWPPVRETRTTLGAIAFLALTRNKDGALWLLTPSNSYSSASTLSNGTFSLCWHTLDSLFSWFGPETGWHQTNVRFIFSLQSTWRWACNEISCFTDVNECNSTSHNCVSEKDGGQCKNQVGFYSCSCRSGYHGNGIKKSAALVNVSVNGCEGQFQENLIGTRSVSHGDLGRIQSVLGGWCDGVGVSSLFRSPANFRS